MKALITTTLILYAAQGVLADEKGNASTVKLVKHDGTVSVTIGGKDFTTFHYGKDLPKPFFSPVITSDGTQITRSLEKPADHPHHKGIWLSIDEVNGVKFWAEKGKIANVSVDLIRPEGNPAEMHVVNHWLDKDGNAVLIEATDIKIHANRLIAYDISLKAGDAQVTFGDTKEGLFGVRLADPFRERVGGKVVNADGLEKSAQCWGKTSDWVDYYATVDGKTNGVAIFDHPLNFRRSRYHVRDYGLFSISPFGNSAYTNGKQPAEELILQPGNSVRLRYAMYFHPGDTAEGKVRDVYNEYLRDS